MAQVLLVDDDEALRNLNTIMLKRGGHTVAGASSGQMALDMVTSQPFDLVMLDVMMPDMNGYEVARKLRANPATENIPIVILTARAQPVDQQAALDAGADAYLSKPVMVENLNRTVAELVSAGRPKKPAAKAHAAGRLTCVLGWRGGVGSTTLAVNLAMVFARARRLVGVIDLAPAFGHAALMFRLRSNASWATLPAEVNAQALGGSLMRHETGIFVLPSPQHLPENSLSPQTFSTIADIMLDAFNEVVIDCAATPDPATRAALSRAGSVILAVAPEAASVQTGIGALAALSALNIAADKIRLVYNQPMAMPIISAAQIEKAIGRPFDAILPFDSQHGRAALLGTPLAHNQPNAPYVAALTALAKTL